MTPISFSDDRRNSRSADAEAERHIFMHATFGHHDAHPTDVIGGESGRMMGFTARQLASENIKPMPIILSRRNPFQITKAVVVSLAVLVVDLVLIGRRKAEKCRCYHATKPVMRLGLSARERQVVVAVGMFGWVQKSASRVLVRRLCAGSYTPHPPQRGSLIEALPFRYRLPLFIHEWIIP